MSEDVTLTWAGTDYTVPADRVMRLGADLEDMLSTDTISAWDRLTKAARFNVNLLSMAYGHALRYAGAPCTDLEVRAALFGSSTEASRMSSAVEGLLAMMTPPASFTGGDPEGKPKPNRKERRASSRRAS